MDLAPVLGHHPRRHSKGRVCFVDFGRHRDDNLCLRRMMRYEVVRTGQGGSCKWHRSLEGGVAAEHGSVDHYLETDLGCSIRWLPCPGIIEVRLLSFGLSKGRSGGQGLSA